MEPFHFNHESSPLEQQDNFDTQHSNYSNSFNGIAETTGFHHPPQFPHIAQANQNLFLPSMSDTQYSLPSINSFGGMNEHTLQLMLGFDSRPSQQPQNLSPEIKNQLLEDIQSSKSKEKQFEIHLISLPQGQLDAIRNEIFYKNGNAFTNFAINELNNHQLGTSFSQTTIEFLKISVAFCRHRKILMSQEINNYLQIRRHEMPQEEKKRAILIGMTEINLRQSNDKFIEKFL